MIPRHEHEYRLILGPDGHGLLYGNYDGYVHRCECGKYRDDYQAYSDTFHSCPSCGKVHREEKAK